MRVTMVLVDLDKSIECLVAKREPVMVALYQPGLELFAEEGTGPRYGSNREIAISKVNTFLQLAGNTRSHLIVLPEFGTPVDTLVGICKGKLNFKEGTLLVLPLEGLPLNDYLHLSDMVDGAVAEFSLGALREVRAGITWVNACAILAVTKNGTKVYIQPKRYASTPEVDTLCCGSDYFMLRGDGIAMSVLLCADANSSQTYATQIAETRKAAPGRYFIHTQWNDEPDYDIYEEFWRSIVTTDPDRNTLISVNMAAGSIIKNNSLTQKIVLPMTRIGYSGNARIDEKYMMS